jgi:hypothetical protein
MGSSHGIKGEQMPNIIIPLSLLGMLPFIALGFGALGNAPQSAAVALVGLIDYAALVLAFAGGVHWGLALLPDSVRPSIRAIGGIIPMVVAWLGVLLAQLVAPGVALAVLILAYLAMVLTEHRASQRLLLASKYVWTRWAFTAVAVTMMVVVLVLRGLGQTIVL